MSGGMGGFVRLWQLEDEKIGPCLFTYAIGGFLTEINEKGSQYKNLSDQDKEPLIKMQKPKNHLQSLHMRGNKILVGTRSGDIWELYRDYNNKNVDVKDMAAFMDRRLFGCDHEIPKVVGFSAEKDRIF